VIKLGVRTDLHAKTGHFVCSVLGGHDIRPLHCTFNINQDDIILFPHSGASVTVNDRRIDSFVKLSQGKYLSLCLFCDTLPVFDIFFLCVYYYARTFVFSTAQRSVVV
jgi:hypothetical protein